MAAVTDQIHVSNPEIIRAQMDLGHFMPPGFETLDQLDNTCRLLTTTGTLLINPDGGVIKAMEQIKDPEIPMSSFRDLSDRIHSIMAQFTYRSLPENFLSEGVKIAISERAGLAAFPHFYRFFRGSEIGFASQTRDEETLETVTNGAKLGSFANKHAIVVDPMLATGGSLEGLIDEVVKRGATEVTTVTTFSAPQGVVRIARHSSVVRMITPFLEAGLDHNGYVVGVQSRFPRLGDSGDRSFGKVD